MFAAPKHKVFSKEIIYIFYNVLFSDCLDCAESLKDRFSLRIILNTLLGLQSPSAQLVQSECYERKNLMIAILLNICRHHIFQFVN